MCHVALGCYPLAAAIVCRPCFAKRVHPRGVKQYFEAHLGNRVFQCNGEKWPLPFGFWPREAVHPLILKFYSGLQYLDTSIFYCFTKEA